MKCRSLLLCCCWWAMPGGEVVACEYPEPPRFEDVAPTAPFIFVFQVLSLEYRHSEGSHPVREWVEGRIQVVEVFRGEPKVSKIRFENGWCRGIRFEVGHSYLVATGISQNPLRFAPGDRTVLDISWEYNPTWPDGVTTSAVLQRLLRAIKSKGSYEDVPNHAYYFSTSTVPLLPDQ